MPDPESSHSIADLQGAVQPRFGEVKIRQRGYLPHWERASGLYFLTFHLADSLPKQVLEKMRERRDLLEAAARAGAHVSPKQKNQSEKWSASGIEELADRGAGSCSLRHPRVGELAGNALRFWDGKRYRLVAWCVMPNHVHVVCRLIAGEELATILHSWKSYTAHRANAILGRKGAFWAREYYDRLIRDGEELARAIRYVVSNPERAGLKDWKWVWGAGEDARGTAGREAGGTPSDRRS